MKIELGAIGGRSQATLQYQLRRNKTGRERVIKRKKEKKGVGGEGEKDREREGEGVLLSAMW